MYSQLFRKKGDLRTCLYIIVNVHPLLGLECGAVTWHLEFLEYEETIATRERIWVQIMRCAQVYLLVGTWCALREGYRMEYGILRRQYQAKKAVEHTSTNLQCSIQSYTIDGCLMYFKGASELLRAFMSCLTQESCWQSRFWIKFRRILTIMLRKFRAKYRIRYMTACAVKMQSLRNRSCSANQRSYYTHTRKCRGNFPYIAIKIALTRPREFF